MNVKDTSIKKKINKPLMQTDYWEFLLLHWEKTYDLSLGMPPFTGSNYIRKKRHFG